MDFKKAFDSIHRESLWRILRAYGIPQQIILVITNFYNNFKDRVGNSEGCPMSVLLFNLTSHWAMCKTTSTRPRGIRRTPFSTLEDLDLAPDLALVTHTYQHMQKKPPISEYLRQQAGLNISQKRTEPLASQSERRFSKNRIIYLPR